MPGTKHQAQESSGYDQTILEQPWDLPTPATFRASPGNPSNGWQTVSFIQKASLQHRWHQLDVQHLRLSRHDPGAYLAVFAAELDHALPTLSGAL